MKKKKTCSMASQSGCCFLLLLLVGGAAWLPPPPPPPFARCCLPPPPPLDGAALSLSRVSGAELSSPFFFASCGGCPGCPCLPSTEWVLLPVSLLPLLGFSLGVTPSSLGFSLVSLLLRSGDGSLSKNNGRQDSST